MRKLKEILRKPRDNLTPLERAFRFYKEHITDEESLKRLEKALEMLKIKDVLDNGSKK